MRYSVTYSINGEVLTDMGIKNLIPFIEHIEFNGGVVLSVASSS